MAVKGSLYPTNTDALKPHSSALWLAFLLSRRRQPSMCS